MNLTVKVFADGADRATMLRLSRDPIVSGFTTNPTLMRKAGVASYEHFARDVLTFLDGKPISFEVFSDEFDEMYDQALQIADWGPNVYVKIPVTNTRGQSSQDLIAALVAQGVQVNVTAILTCEQVAAVTDVLAGGPNCYVSVFAGRIADTGRDPLPVMREALRIISPASNVELIWASTREVLNVVQADQCGCHIITVTSEILGKIASLGRDLAQVSLDTVKMFRTDALAAGYSLSLEPLQRGASAAD
jgi:transaldolase